MSDDMRTPEEILDVNRKWLPPSPHVEKVVEMVQNGSAHIQKRGHHEAPLIMFEDGGVIELPKARYEETYRGMQLVAGDKAADTGVTKFRDVCGCVDYIKGVLKDDPASVQGDPHKFDQLLDHALYMIDRMYKREDEYRKFLADVIALCAQTPKGPDPKMASKACDEIRFLLHNHPEDTVKYTELLDLLVEDVRHVASKQEKVLGQHKDIAVKVNNLYKEVKGARNWGDEK